MQIKRFLECYLLASFQSCHVLRKVERCPCDWRESRTRISLIVKKSAYYHINEEHPEGTTKPYFRSSMRPLQIPLSVSIEHFTITG